MKTLRESTIGQATVRLVKTDEGYAGIVSVKSGSPTTIKGDDRDDVWRRLCDAAAKSEPGLFVYDKPEILPYPLSRNCLIGAEPGQFAQSGSTPRLDLG